MIMSQSAQSDIYRPIIEQIADAIIYSDSEGIIRVWNAAAMEIFGYTKDEAIGQSLDLIIPERLRAAHWVGFNRAMERGMTQHAGRATVTRALTRDGGSVFVRLRKSCSARWRLVTSRRRIHLCRDELRCGY